MLVANPNLIEELVSAGIKPKKAGIAWKRLCKILQEFGRQEERGLFVTMCSEHRLFLGLHRSHCSVVLTFHSTFVMIEMGAIRESILLVKIRNNGVAYAMGGKLYSATRLALELLRRFADKGFSTVNEAAQDVSPVRERPNPAT